MPTKLELPRKATGKEILNAFRTAAKFQESPTLKWEIDDYEIISGESGCCAIPIYQGFISRLFSRWHEPLWKAKRGINDRFMTQVRLLPLFPSEVYSEVQWQVHHEYDLNVGGGFKTADSPDDPGFAPIKPAYDRIVKNFLKELN